MKILKTKMNIFDLPRSASDAVCVTTNGMVKRSGYAVMGKGIALECDNRYHVSYKLAQHLKRHGNRPCDLGQYDSSQFHLVSFPTKNDWRNKSDIKLIKQSAEFLKDICDKQGIQTCYLPPLGCGGLDWEKDVKPVVENILDDRFVIVFRY